MEIDRLYTERRARPKPPITGRADFEAEAAAALWTANWYERLLEQHRFLSEWAQYTRQPFAVRQAIGDAERVALQKSLGARARAGQWEICAAAAVMGAPAAPVRAAA
jgi:hypothetical protein